jgi:hypothetical protein
MFVKSDQNEFASKGGGVHIRLDDSNSTNSFRSQAYYSMIWYNKLLQFADKKGISMAIAGGTVPAILLRYDGKRLEKLGSHRPLAHLAVDPVEAVTKLNRGQAVYLKLLGNNLRIVQEAFEDGN